MAALSSASYAAARHHMQYSAPAPAPSEVVGQAFSAGVLAFNAGNPGKCAEIYNGAVCCLLDRKDLPLDVQVRLQQAFEKSQHAADSSAKAWALREGLDAVTNMPAPVPVLAMPASGQYQVGGYPLTAAAPVHAPIGPTLLQSGRPGYTQETKPLSKEERKAAKRAEELEQFLDKPTWDQVASHHLVQHERRAADELPYVESMVLAGKFAELAYLGKERTYDNPTVNALAEDAGKPIPTTQVNLETGLELMGFKLVRVIDVMGSDTQAFIADNGDTLVMSFRGTESVTDALTDIWVSSQLFQPLVDKPLTMAGERKDSCPMSRTNQRQVHSGFYGGFMSAIEAIDAELIPRLRSGRYTRFILTGHSLGGALAKMCAAYLLEVCEANAADEPDEDDLLAALAGSSCWNPVAGTAPDLQYSFTAKEEAQRLGLTYDNFPSEWTFITFGQPAAGTQTTIDWFNQAMEKFSETHHAERQRVVNGQDIVPYSTKVAGVRRYKHHAKDDIVRIHPGGVLDFNADDPQLRRIFSSEANRKYALDHFMRSYTFGLQLARDRMRNGAWVYEDEGMMMGMMNHAMEMMGMN